MPFGHNCEHPNFDSCVRAMTGKVDTPTAFCAALMRETEEMCRQRHRADMPAILEMVRETWSMLRGHDAR